MWQKDYAVYSAKLSKNHKGADGVYNVRSFTTKVIAPASKHWQDR